MDNYFTLVIIREILSHHQLTKNPKQQAPSLYSPFPFLQSAVACLCGRQELRFKAHRLGLQLDLQSAGDFRMLHYLDHHFPLSKRENSLLNVNTQLNF